MLKITTQSDVDVTKMILEGCLVGPWVEELDRCWRGVEGARQERVLVDLTGVTFIAPEGKALLTKMWQQGAKLHAVGCLTKCIVDEISKPDSSWSSHPLWKGPSKRS